MTRAEQVRVRLGEVAAELGLSELWVAGWRYTDDTVELGSPTKDTPTPQETCPHCGGTDAPGPHWTGAWDGTQTVWCPGPVTSTPEAAAEPAWHDRALTAHLPAAKYEVERTADGWDVYALDVEAGGWGRPRETHPPCGLQRATEQQQ